MALNQMQKDRLEKLSLEKEGVSSTYKSKARETQSPTLLISLGGLGGETLNMLKGKVLQSIGEDTPNLRFLVVDTDETSFSQIKKGEGGYMEEGECLSIYNPAIAGIMAEGYDSAPEDIKTWLSPLCERITLSNNGAQQKRQVGRVMILNGATQTRMTNTLRECVLSLNRKGGKLTILLVAGISGGTGSGTIVDFTYFLRDVLNTQCNLNKQYSIEAYVFTPDVQFSVPSIANNPALQTGLMKNGYSALKELDYFYNLKKHGGVYSVRVGGATRTSREDIFETCTLVSGAKGGAGGTYTKQEVMVSLTDHLLDQISDTTVNTDQGQVQMVESLYSNLDRLSSEWLQRPENISYPKAAFFRYNLIGYSSVCIPRNEILAYLAYNIFGKVYEEWKNLNAINKDYVTTAMSKSGGTNYASMEELALRVLGGMQPPAEMEIEYPDALWPNKGDYKSGTDDVRRNAERLGQGLANRLTSDERFRGLMVNAIKSEISRQLDACFDNLGPFASIELLTHRINDHASTDPREPFSGILETLSHIQNEMGNQVNELNKVMTDENIWKMEEPELRRSVQGAVFGANNAIKNHVNFVCEQVEKYTVRLAFYQEIQKAIADVIDYFVTENNSIWSVYTDVLDAISNLLEHNYDVATHSGRYQEGNLTTYSFDVINLYEQNEKKDKLEKYLNAFLTQDNMNAIARKFIDSMRDKRKAWTDAQASGEFDVEEEVQALFDDFFFSNVGKKDNTTETSDLMERFIVAAYAPQAVDAAKVDEIWEHDEDQKDRLLASAAREILDELEKNGKPLGNVEATSMAFDLAQFGSVKYLIIPDETPHIYEHIKSEIELRKTARPFYSSMQPVKGEGTCKFSLLTLHYGLPMYVVAKFDAYDEAYRSADPKLDWHLHMDANLQNWKRLPNPFIIDRAALTDAQHYKDYEDYKIQAGVNEKMQEAIKLGLIYREKDTHGDEQPYYSIHAIDTAKMPSFDVMGAKIEEYAKANLGTDMGDDIQELMKQIGYVMSPVKLSIDAVLLKGLDTDDRGGEGIPDLAKIIRMSQQFMNLLEENLKEWKNIKEKLDEKMKELEKFKKYRNYMVIFANGIKTGLINVSSTTPVVSLKCDGIRELITLTDQRGQNKADKKYFLYHAFTAFLNQSDANVQQVKKIALDKIKKDEVITDQHPLEGMMNPVELQNSVNAIMDKNLSNPALDRDSLEEELEGANEDYGITGDLKAKKDDHFENLRFFFNSLLKEFEE